MRPHERQDRLEDAAADVVEVDVDSVRADGSEIMPQLFAAVIDRRVEAEIALEHAVLIVGAGHTHDPGSDDARDLAGDAAGRARRSRDDDRLAPLWTAYVQQAVVGGETGDAEHAQVMAEWAADGDREDTVGRDDRVLLPSRLALDDRSGLDRRTVRRDHFAQGAAGHHVALAQLFAVGPALHPRPVRRVDREQDRADEQLAGTGLPDRRVDRLEVRLLELPPRALDQQDLAVGAFSHGAPPRGLYDKACRLARTLPLLGV